MIWSHPSRVRGLKYFLIIGHDIRSLVALFTGAWIEIYLMYVVVLATVGSHPSRVRGLKSITYGTVRSGGQTSHPSRVRGLK